MFINLNDKPSIAHVFMAQLRDQNIQKDAMRFRRNLERMGEIFAYELSQYLTYHINEVETPLGIANVPLPTEQLVLCPVLRAGLPLHQGLLNYFDDAENAFVSAYRKHHKDGSFDIRVEYISCPTLEDKVLIVADPMLATGASVHATLKALKSYGTPKAIYLVTVVASNEGISLIQRRHPDVHIWTAAVDEELTAKSYIVPGLGDAGDLAFGEKIGAL